MANSSFELKEKQGSLFPNSGKNFQDPNDKRPHYTGQCIVNGQRLFISAWLKTSAAGTQYLSLSFQEPFQRDAAGNVIYPQNATPGFAPQQQFAPQGYPQTGAGQSVPQAPAYPPQSQYPGYAPQQPAYTPAQPSYPQPPVAPQYNPQMGVPEAPAAPGMPGDMPNFE